MPGSERSRATSLRWASTADHFSWSHGRVDVLVRCAEQLLAHSGEEGAEFSDARVRVRGQVHGPRLPRLARLGVEVPEARGVRGEEDHPVGVHVVRMARQLPVRVVGDDDFGPELPHVPHHLADGLVERHVQQARPAGGRPGDTGVGVAEHTGHARAEDP